MKHIAIFGAGPSALFLSYKLLESGFKVSLYEKTRAAGKKFLVAGKSDLNITNSEDIESFSKKYFKDEDLFYSMLKDFGPNELVSWLEDLDIKTFVGTSGRIFPKDIKASAILKKLLTKLKVMGLKFYPESKVIGVSAQSVELSNGNHIEADVFVYSFGGKSWKVTGSDGLWIDLFKSHDIEVSEFMPSNCSATLKVSDYFKTKFKRVIFKNIKLITKSSSFSGDLVLNENTLEGTPIYSISRDIRLGLEVYIDFKPDLSLKALKKLFSSRNKKKSLSHFFQNTLKLNPAVFILLRDYHEIEFMDSHPKLIKSFRLDINELVDIDEAISTSGGISMTEVSSSLELKKLPRHFVMGEMLDWDTITGGYLLQGCFSMANRIYLNLLK